MAYTAVLVLSLAGSLLAEAQNSSAWSIGKPVKTTSGTVNGHVAPWPANSALSEYLGIPFGKNPTGDLRFANPQRFYGNGTIPGDKWSIECMQIADGLMAEAKEMKNLPQDLVAFGMALEGDEKAVFGEDCLKLNIWTKPQTGEKGKAVMIWIMGGAYSAGASQAKYYSPARFAAEHDVVAVSINYRMNMLGFPGTTFVPDKNPGLLDQRLAVEWVRDNIAAFGGDPKRITIFGESAGGTSVDFYTYAWTQDPIVNGFISQSGTANGLAGNPQDDTSWWVVSNHTGCGLKSVGAAKSLDCMRKLPIKTFIDGVRQCGAGGGKLAGAASIASFWPVVDGKTVFADQYEREKRGAFIKRPMLIGNNDHEGNIIVGATIAGLKAATALGAKPETVTKLNDAFDWAYNGESSAAVALRWILKFIEDGVFNCPAAGAAEARVKAGVPIWRFRFMGVWKNTNLGGLGAFHVSDVPLVLGTSERKQGAAKNEPEQDVLIKNVMTAWSTFAKDPDDGLTKLGWPKYNVKGNSLVRLGYQNKGKVDFGPATQYDRNCRAMGHVPRTFYNQKPLIKRAIDLFLPASLFSAESIKDNTAGEVEKTTKI